MIASPLLIARTPEEMYDDDDDDIMRTRNGIEIERQIDGEKLEMRSGNLWSRSSARCGSDRVFFCMLIMLLEKLEQVATSPLSIRPLAPLLDLELLRYDMYPMNFTLREIGEVRERPFGAIEVHIVAALTMILYSHL